jgi:hypothetical protein
MSHFGAPFAAGVPSADRLAKRPASGTYSIKSATIRRAAGRLFPDRRCAGKGYFVLCKARRLCYTLRRANPWFRLFLGSSAVEHSTVNRMVAGSNPARGANQIKYLAQKLNFRQKPRVCIVSANALPPSLLREIEP